MCKKNRAKEYYNNNKDVLLYKQQRINITAFKK